MLTPMDLGAMLKGKGKGGKKGAKGDQKGHKGGKPSTKDGKGREPPKTDPNADKEKGLLKG